MQHYNFNDLNGELPDRVRIIWTDTLQSQTVTDLFSGESHKEPLLNARTEGLFNHGIPELVINNIPHLSGAETLKVIAANLLSSKCEPHDGDIISAGYVKHTCIKEGNVMRLAWMGN